MRYMKIAGAIAAATMAFTLVACGANNAPAPQDESSSAPVAAPAADQTEAPEATSAVAQDGQNPVMNVVGPYACGRASMMIEPNGESGAHVTIDWSSSAAETTQWVMNGTFDAESLTISYTGATKTDRVFAEDGSIESEEVAYADGTGSFAFNDDGNGTTLTWQDNKEDAGADMVFEFAA